MTDEAKRCVKALRTKCRKEASCNACNKNSFCHQHGDEELNDLAADLIESLAAELEQVKRERDALQMELDELNEEYFVDIHTARDPMAEKVKQLERERDAAVADITRECHKCKHFKVLFNGCTPDYDCDRSDVCRDNDNWQWRGVKE